MSKKTTPSAPLPLSVFLIAKNEEDRIGGAIKSVIGWVDEIIMVDSGSTDRTIAIAKSLNAKTYHKNWEGFGRQKRYGESLCRNDWILNLDADEIITESLKQSIVALFQSGRLTHDIYRLRFVDVPPHSKQEFKSYGIWDYIRPGGYHKRLYNRHKAQYRDSPIHDSVILKSSDSSEDTVGTIGTLKGNVLHYSSHSFDQMVAKLNFYSTMQAKALLREDRKISVLRLLFEPFLAFFKNYIMRRYFLWGLAGFINANIYSFQRFLRLAKARERFLMKQDKKY